MSSALWIWVSLISIGSIQDVNAINFGVKASESLFRYMVAISDETGVICGGAVLDETHILTAAHCVFCTRHERLTILAGRSDLRSASVVRRGVEAIYKHPYYKGMAQQNDDEQLCGASESLKRVNITNDIAMLTLYTPLPLGQNIVPVELPRADFLPFCQMLNFAGWGAGEDDSFRPYLQFMDFTIQGSDPDDDVEYPLPINQFYGVDMFRIQSPNQGDSGGPLVFKNVVYGVLVGQWSSGLSLFTNVYHALDFIKAAMQM